MKKKTLSKQLYRKVSNTKHPVTEKNCQFWPVMRIEMNEAVDFFLVISEL